MSLNKKGIDLKAIARDQKAIDALPNRGRTSVDHNSHAKHAALKKKTDRSPIKLGEGSLSERKHQASRANADMRRRKSFYTPANKRAGLI